MEQTIKFHHAQSAHCESGVCSNLLNHAGLSVTEAMAFGIGGGLFFGYLPFIRIHGLPLVTYRAAAGNILKRFSRLDGFSLYHKQFKSRAQAEAELDDALARSIPVGLQTGVFWLPYFPKALRFHFNAHNIVVYGREGDEYLVSDPVFPGPVRCSVADMTRARFASGALAPRGKMYYFTDVPAQQDYDRLIHSGIQFVCKMMISSPFPLIGVKGIGFLAKRLEKWPHRLGRADAQLHLGHVVRMQEEIGTGGGGFRFMYAAFLQESARKLSEPYLDECAALLTRSGDMWRQFAVVAARICKDRKQPGDTYAAMAAQLRECASLEVEVFRDLEQWLNGR